MEGEKPITGLVESFSPGRTQEGDRKIAAPRTSERHRRQRVEVGRRRQQVQAGRAPNGAGQGGAVHLVTNAYSFDNRACGFVRNNNPDVPTLMSCGADGNGTNYCQLTSSPQVTITMTGAQGKAAVRNADGSLPAIH